MSKDKIEIHNLECFGYHGVLEEEKTLGNWKGHPPLSPTQ